MAAKLHTNVWGLQPTTPVQRAHVHPTPSTTEGKRTSTSSWLQPSPTGELLWVIGTTCAVGLLVFVILFISQPPQVIVRGQVCHRRVAVAACVAAALAAALPFRRWMRRLA